MSCVDEQTAEKIARRKALGRLGGLRRGVRVIRLRVGEDWLFGFLKVKFREGGFQAAVKFAYVDCKGAAFEKIPPSIEEKVKRYLEDSLAAVLERELGNAVR
jgi:hypothetical protein